MKYVEVVDVNCNEIHNFAGEIHRLTADLILYELLNITDIKSDRF